MLSGSHALAHCRMTRFKKVASLSSLPPGSSLSVEVEGRSIALFHAADGIRAVDAECTHAGAPLCEGELEGDVLTCPWHAATFDVVSGKALSRPASLDLKTWPVRVEGDDVLVDLG
jgi:nitrite reductase/ring-hydroxylating ferredoxin subunit